MVVLVGSALAPWRRFRCDAQSNADSEIANANKKKKVVIVGGTGRVGSSTARALSNLFNIILVGRNQEKGQALAAELHGEFFKADIEDLNSLKEALKGADLVVHTAGPFQKKNRCTVLEAAIECKTAYIDVCDDIDYANRAKELHERAVHAGVPALVTTGIFPGVSNIMAAELVRLARESSSECRPESLRFSYFTAGTGGTGPTILATSFFLLGDEVLTYVKGELVKRRPYSGEQIVDFGKGVGKRSVFLLNLAEVATAYKLLNVPSVSARFGTSPFFWNWVMSYIAGKSFLKDPDLVNNFVKLSDPVVRIFDALVGEKLSMRVDLECSDGRKAVGLFTHKKTSVSIGVSVAAFARAVLEGSTEPGVWFPEQEQGIALKDRTMLLQRASKGTLNYAMNRSPWMIESNPKEIGFGIYLE